MHLCRGSASFCRGRVCVGLFDCITNKGGSHERQDLRRTAACRPLLHAAHRPAAGGGFAAGYRQFLHQRDHAGGLRPDRRHLPRLAPLHRPGHHEPVRQRGLQQPRPPLCDGRGHRYGQKGEGGGRPLRRYFLPGHEHRHLGHDQRQRRGRGDGRQHHYFGAGHHLPADGRFRRHHRRSGGGGPPQPLL